MVNLERFKNFVEQGEREADRPAARTTMSLLHASAEVHVHESAPKSKGSLLQVLHLSVVHFRAAEEHDAVAQEIQ